METYKLKVLKVVEKTVVDNYRAIENGVVAVYKKVEAGTVDAYKKVEDIFKDTFLIKAEKPDEVSDQCIMGK